MLNIERSNKIVHNYVSIMYLIYFILLNPKYFLLIRIKIRLEICQL